MMADHEKTAREIVNGFQNMTFPAATRLKLAITRALALAEKEGLRRGVAECDSWLESFGAIEIHHTSARQYACDVLNDIRDGLRALAEESPE